MSAGNCSYVRDHYRVPACIGRRVVIDGKPGIIVADRGNYIGVTLDCQKAGRVDNYHPTDGVEYGGMGKIRKVSRGAENYREFQDSDCFDSFGDFLRYKQWKKKEGECA